jgi:hypothetical protein
MVTGKNIKSDVLSQIEASISPQFHPEPRKKPTGIFKNSPSPHLRLFFHVFVNCVPQKATGNSVSSPALKVLSVISPSWPGFLPLSGQEPRMNTLRGTAGDWKHYFQVELILHACLYY